MNTLLIPLHGAGAFGPHLFGGFLTALLIVVLAIMLLRHGRVGPVRWAGSGGRPTASHRTPEDDALASLKAKLAAGDITTEEYLTRTSVLRRPDSDKE
ncbi:SHOCT domain-containing protein [Nigerium massiliense]|uniref:SHOCT domain-containing protein n=1 Tax=Nigerium massiliense TaxID=1522317 RepID=UPI0005908F52|nr:hypothetical protein [Nigerium massiliense]